MACSRKPSPLGTELDRLGEGGTLCRSPPSHPWPTGFDPIGKGAWRVADRENSPLKGGPAVVAEVVTDPRQILQERAIDALPMKSADFAFEGQTYRIIRGAEWNETDLGERYLVVPFEQARSVLAKMIAVPATPPVHKTAFGAVSELLPPPPFTPIENGLMLLRVIPVIYARAASSAMAMTPSQVKKLEAKEEEEDKTSWFRLSITQLVDGAEQPVPGLTINCKLTDVGHTSQVTSEDASHVHIDDLTPGGKADVLGTSHDEDVWEVTSDV